MQAEGGGSGSQGSHHSPKAGTESPAKKQKTGMAPTAQPASTNVGEYSLLHCSEGYTIVCRKAVTSYSSKMACHVVMITTGLPANARYLQGES